jgi:hypothetical protein
VSSPRTIAFTVVTFADAATAAATWADVPVTAPAPAVTGSSSTAAAITADVARRQ